jgi:hypothetical protein
VFVREFARHRDTFGLGPIAYNDQDGADVRSILAQDNIDGLPQ